MANAKYRAQRLQLLQSTCSRYMKRLSPHVGRQAWGARKFKPRPKRVKKWMSQQLPRLYLDMDIINTYLSYSRISNEVSARHVARGMAHGLPLISVYSRTSTTVVVAYNPETADVFTVLLYDCCIFSRLTWPSRFSPRTLKKL